MNNPLTVLPAAARRWLYLAYAVLGPVLVWTQAKGWTGDSEYALWIGLGTALGLLAAANTTSPVAVVDVESPSGEVAGEASDLPKGTPTVTSPVDALTLDDAATDEKPTKPAHGWGDGI